MLQFKLDFLVPILTGPNDPVEHEVQAGPDANQADGFKVPYKGPVVDKGTYYVCYPPAIFSCTVPIQLLLYERN